MYFSAALLKRIGQYEMVIPTLVDENGRFLSYSVSHFDGQGRTRRDLDSQSNPPIIFYRINAFGLEFHFKLQINSELFSRSFSAGAFGDGGEEHSVDTSENCHYVGYSASPQKSTAAISNCFGLVNILVKFLKINYICIFLEGGFFRLHKVTF